MTTAQKRISAKHGRKCLRKLFGVTLYKNVNFKNDVKTLHKIAGQKLHASNSNYTDIEKLRIVRKDPWFLRLACVQLCVGSVIDQLTRNKINNIHKRVLRGAYKDICSNFKEIFTKANTVSVNNKNLQLPAIELDKTHWLQPQIT